MDSITVDLCWCTEADPFNKLDCKVTDIGWSDRVLVVECPEARKEVEQLSARISELEAENEDMAAWSGRIREIVAKLKAEIQRKDEALKFYANKKNWRLYSPQVKFTDAPGFVSLAERREVDRDEGHKARAALGGGE